MKETTKGTADTFDIGFDWTDQLADIAEDEVIAESEWELLSGSVTINTDTVPQDGLPGHTFGDYETSAWVTGGLEGSRAELKNTIVTSPGGRTLSDTIELTVLDRIDSAAAGRYTTLAEIEKMYARFNVRKWAQIEEHDSADIDARVLAFIADAEDYIDCRLRGGRYAVPFVAPIPRLINRLAARLAGVLLYEARGVVDYDPNSGAPSHRLGYSKKDFDRQLDDIKSGRLRLDIADRGVTHPQVIDDEDLEWYQKPRYPYDRMPWDSRQLY